MMRTPWCSSSASRGHRPSSETKNLDWESIALAGEWPFWAGHAAVSLESLTCNGGGSVSRAKNRESLVKRGKNGVGRTTDGKDERGKDENGAEFWRS
jgi:hypothetical protein